MPSQINGQIAGVGVGGKQIPNFAPQLKIDRELVLNALPRLLAVDVPLC